jgi:hypothetical protein
MRFFIDLIESAGAITWETPKGRHNDVPVWIDIQALDHSWAQDELHVGQGGEGGMKRRYDGFGRWIASATVPVQMPEVALSHRNEVAFTNGRHRFSWLRDHGAEAMPVLVDKSQAGEFARRFGTSVRITKYHPE